VKEAILTFVSALWAGSMIFSTATPAQKLPPGRKGAQVRIIKGPALESVTSTSAIIRWETNTGGGTVVDYGVVHYGTQPDKLDYTARSPNRWNRNLPYMVYRVYVDHLKPGTTYYYTVDSTQANGAVDASSAVNRFTTRR